MEKSNLNDNFNIIDFYFSFYFWDQQSDKNARL